MAAGLFHTDPKAGTHVERRHREHLPRRPHRPVGGRDGAGHHRAQHRHRRHRAPGVRQGVPLPAASSTAGHRSAPTSGPTSAPMEALIDDDTVLVVGSSPCYPYGVIDPIPELAALASGRGILMHVDACLGGWLLPWWERLGEPVPPWDFRVPGVTSLSADIHKYGYTFKGASLDPLPRPRRWCSTSGSSTTTGPAGSTARSPPPAPGRRRPIAGAWATDQPPRRRGLPAQGHPGARRHPRVRGRHRRPSTGSPITAPPDLSRVRVRRRRSRARSTSAPSATSWTTAGWNLDRQQGGLHLMVSPYHVHMVDAVPRRPRATRSPTTARAGARRRPTAASPTPTPTG